MESEFRNPSVCEKLLRNGYIQDKDGLALQFFGRVMLGLMTKTEWIGYAMMMDHAEQLFSRRWSKHHVDKPYVIQLSFSLAYWLRHNQKMLSSADRADMVDLRVLVQNLNIRSATYDPSSGSMCTGKL